MDELTGLLSCYLTLMEERNLQEASRYLAPGARLIFPGGKTYSALAEVAQAARGRYRWVKKQIERWDTFPQDEGKATVYCLGTLYGEALDGSPFQGIRFVDRFEVQNGLITLQEVWNDLAEHGLVPHGS
jgi:hypothetical protein